MLSRRRAKAAAKGETPHKTERRERGQRGVHGALAHTMGMSNPPPGAEQRPPSAWEDVGPRDDRRTFKLWRSRQPLGTLGPTNVELAVAVAGDLDLPATDNPDNDRGDMVCMPTSSFVTPLACPQVRKGGVQGEERMAGLILDKFRFCAEERHAQI